ncbi:MAG TPA: ribosome maturation factor RimM [Solimonas sp.]|nr:ribosome maturation factor RimM [Solimonas sp.]
MLARRVTLGRVSGVHGVRGGIKVWSLTRPIENLFEYRSWWITHREGFEAKVLESHVHDRSLVAYISGPDGQPITDRDIAAGLMGAEIQVEHSAMPKLPKGQYYWFDLIGVKVESTLGVALGQVEDMTSNGAQDVMVLRNGERQRLIPFVKEHIVKEVDLEAGRIVCDWHPDYDED